MRDFDQYESSTWQDLWGWAFLLLIVKVCWVEYGTGTPVSFIISKFNKKGKKIESADIILRAVSSGPGRNGCLTTSTIISSHLLCQTGQFSRTILQWNLILVAVDWGKGSHPWYELWESRRIRSWILPTYWDTMRAYLVLTINDTAWLNWICFNEALISLIQKIEGSKISEFRPIILSNGCPKTF